MMLLVGYGLTGFAFVVARRAPDGDAGVDQLFAKGIEARNGSFLVRAHEPAVTDHIGDEDRGKPSFGAFFGHVARPLSRHSVHEIVLAAGGGVYGPSNVRFGSRLCENACRKSVGATIGSIIADA